MPRSTRPPAVFAAVLGALLLFAAPASTPAFASLLALAAAVVAFTAAGALAVRIDTTAVRPKSGLARVSRP